MLLVLPWSVSTTGVASKPERADPSASEAAREPGSDAQSRPLEKKRDAAYSAFSDQNFHKVHVQTATPYSEAPTYIQKHTVLAKSGEARSVLRDMSDVA